MDAGSLLVFWVIFAVIVAIAANSRGRSAIGWFLLAILISPLLALIAVLVMGPGSRNAVQPAQAINASPAVAADPRKACPDCGEQVPVIARICRFCRYEFKDVPANPPGGVGSPSASPAAIPAVAPASSRLRQPTQSPATTHETFDRYGPPLVLAIAIGVAFTYLGSSGLEPFSDIQLGGPVGYALLLVSPVALVGLLSWLWYRTGRSGVVS